MQKRSLFVFAGLACAVAATCVLARSDAMLPLWPYGTTSAARAAAELPGGEPVFAALRKANAPLHLADTQLTFTPAQAAAPYAGVDWYPDAHPPMPELVSHGRKADGVLACALCHHPDGYGRPENANIRGLAVDYIVRQMEGFKNGERTSADPQKSNTRLMIAAAKGLTHDEMVEVASYYGGMRATESYERVVESATAPKIWSEANGATFALAVPNAGSESFSQAIVEIPEDAVQAEVYRNPREIYVAYVPPGSIARGKVLATRGGGKTTACAACHGSNFAGTEIAPPLAGRSPSYIGRQLFDIQRGARRNAPAMIPVAAQLTPDDIIDLAAYLGSLGSKG
ncbi:MAG TPA: c-type cytochrome [Candidatus Baltobacteraceae bacterium]|nr:c-type cytochrome [Candidatus Baltobacteraceae bacterium]